MHSSVVPIPCHTELRSSVTRTKWSILKHSATLSFISFPEPIADETHALILDRLVHREFQILFKSTKVILISIIDFRDFVIKSSIIPRVFNEDIREGRRSRLNDFQFKIVEVK